MFVRPTSFTPLRIVSAPRLQKGWTALHYAAKSGATDVAKLLIAYGADVLAVDAERKSPYDIAMATPHMAVRALLRPHTVSALRSDTAGAALERQRLAEELGMSAPIALVPPVAVGEPGTVVAAKQMAALQASLDAANAGMKAPDIMSIPPRLDVRHLHPHMLPMEAGVERVLFLETLSDRARWLSCNWVNAIAHLLMCAVDCKLFCWQVVRPRAYVRITENSVEYNNPIIACPVDSCVRDHVSKIYFDRSHKTIPFRSKLCSPYHCCCMEPCGQVVVFAPCKCCANEFCLFACGHILLSTGLMTILPGLHDADGFVTYYNAVRARTRCRCATAPTKRSPNIACLHASGPPGARLFLRAQDERSQGRGWLPLLREEVRRVRRYRHKLNWKVIPPRAPPPTGPRAARLPSL